MQSIRPFVVLSALTLLTLFVAFRSVAQVTSDGESLRRLALLLYEARVAHDLLSPEVAQQRTRALDSGGMTTITCDHSLIWAQSEINLARANRATTQTMEASASAALAIAKARPQEPRDKNEGSSEVAKALALVVIARANEELAGSANEKEDLAAAMARYKLRQAACATRPLQKATVQFEMIENAELVRSLEAELPLLKSIADQLPLPALLAAMSEMERRIHDAMTKDKRAVELEAKVKQLTSPEDTNALAASNTALTNAAKKADARR